MGVKGVSEGPILLARADEAERETPIQLEGSVRSIDLETGESPQETFSPDDNSPVELAGIRLDIDERGVPLKPAGHCRAITPLISREAAKEIQNPLGKGIVWVANGLLGVIDTSLNFAFGGVAKGDEYIFANGLDHATQVNKIDQPILQSSARWGERAALVTLGVGAVSGIRARSWSAALQAPKTFWKSAWPIGAALYLSSTQIASHASKGFDVIDYTARKMGAIGETEHVFNGESRRWARAGFYAGMFGSAALLLNFPARVGYRKIVAPQPPPPNAKPIAAKFGLGAAVFYFGWNWYWDNVSAHQRILPALYDEPAWHAYLPWHFKTEMTQAHTSAAHSLAWGLFVYVWAALPGWQTTWADGISRGGNFLARKTFGLKEGPFITSKSLPILPDSPEAKFISRGSLGVTRGLRAVGVRLFTPGRFVYTGVATMAGLPLGIGIGRMMEMAQSYSSKEALSGTPYRALITSPLATAGTTYFTAAQGFSRSWESYAFNMIPVNFTWAACSKQGENVYQVARTLADDYQSSEDSNERRHLATLLFNLHRFAYDNGKSNNEKRRIGELLADAGLDVNAIEDAAVRYASPELQ